jgi:hypothetical protein
MLFAHAVPPGRGSQEGSGGAERVVAIEWQLRSGPEYACPRDATGTAGQIRPPPFPNKKAARQNESKL